MRRRALLFSVLLLVVGIGWLLTGAFFGVNPLQLGEVHLPVARFRPGSVTHLAERHVFVVRRADGAFHLFLDQEPIVSDRLRWVEGEGVFRTNCIVVRPPARASAPGRSRG